MNAAPTIRPTVQPIMTIRPTVQPIIESVLRSSNSSLTFGQLSGCRLLKSFAVAHAGTGVSSARCLLRGQLEGPQRVKLAYPSCLQSKLDLVSRHRETLRLRPPLLSHGSTTSQRKSSGQPGPHKQSCALCLGTHRVTASIVSRFATKPPAVNPLGTKARWPNLLSRNNDRPHQCRCKRTRTPQNIPRTWRRRGAARTTGRAIRRRR